MMSIFLSHSGDCQIHLQANAGHRNTYPKLQPSLIFHTCMHWSRRKGNHLTNVEERPGDWRCECGTINFSWRQNCFSCGLSKPERKFKQQIRSEDDWECEECGNINFARYGLRARVFSQFLKRLQLYLTISFLSDVCSATCARLPGHQIRPCLRD